MTQTFPTQTQPTRPNRGARIAVQVILGLIGVIVVIVVLGAIFGGGDPEPTTPAPASSTRTLTSAEQAVAASLRGAFPDVVTGTDEQVIRDLRNVCLDVEQGKTPAQVLTSAAARFDGATPAQVAAIVGVAKARIC